MLAGLRTRFEKRQQRDGAEQQRDDARRDRVRNRSSSLRPSAAQQFVHAVDRRRRNVTCSSVSGCPASASSVEHGRQDRRGSDRWRDDDAPRRQQHERQKRPRESERPENLQRDRRGKREDRRAR